MSHLNSIGAAMFSDLSFSIPSTDYTATEYTTFNSSTEFFPRFSAELQPGAALTSRVGTYSTPGLTTYCRIKNVRSFPAMGTPPNIVKVPVYGSKTSFSIQGQADAPQLELDINYVASEWAKSTGTPTLLNLGDYIGNGQTYLFRFTLLNAEPANYNSIDTTGMGVAVAGAAIQNSQYFWVGKLESLLVTPSLTDATTAKLTMSIQSQFFGAFTNT